MIIKTLEGDYINLDRHDSWEFWYEDGTAHIHLDNGQMDQSLVIGKMTKEDFENMKAQFDIALKPFIAQHCAIDKPNTTYCPHCRHGSYYPVDKTTVRCHFCAELFEIQEY